MSVQPVTAIKGNSASSDSSVQSDYQVHQLESQIKDWSTCPTTPPAIKKQIVAKLQTELDGVETSLKSHANNVQAQKQNIKPNQNAQEPAQQRFVSPFRVDTYA